MPQIFVPAKNIQGQLFSLDEKESHHLVRVLRQKSGDVVTLFDGEGHRYRGELTNVEAGQVQGRILEKLAGKTRKVTVKLFQGLPKGSKFDYVIEKAVELGVDGLVPFLSKKNLIKAQENSKTKQSRWIRLAEAAGKQSNRTTMPSIAPVCQLSELGEELSVGLSLVFTLDEAALALKPILQEAKASQLSRINIIIGPESGLAKEEMSWLLSLGCKPVSLGGLTLRTETAGLAALAALNYEFDLA